MWPRVYVFKSRLSVHKLARLQTTTYKYPISSTQYDSQKKMPKAGSKAIPAPRKALQEATSSELNKKRSSETTLDPTQVKKAKPSTSKTKESTTSTKSSAEAPEFVTAITLPGEEQV